MGDGGSVEGPPRPRMRPILLLHYLWTIPLAVVLSLLPWFYGSINVCGVSGCTGGGFGVSYGNEFAKWVCAAVIAFLFFASIAAVPWSRPHIVRVIVAAVIGLAIGGWLIGGWLSAKYQYYPAGGGCYPSHTVDAKDC